MAGTVVLAVLLAGCSVSSATPTTTAAAIAPSTRAGEAVAEVSGVTWPELPEGVLATGTPEGAAQGLVKMLNNGDGMLTVRVEGFGIDLERYSGALSPDVNLACDPG